MGIHRRKADRADTVGAYGDIWTFFALDADTKLIPSFVVGKRDTNHARAFISDLAERWQERVQISKTYSFVTVAHNAATRCSPAEVVKTEKAIISTSPSNKPTQVPKHYRGTTAIRSLGNGTNGHNETVPSPMSNRNSNSCVGQKGGSRIRFHLESGTKSGDFGTAPR